MKKLIETEHISFSYEEETGLPLVLEDVNITIGEGEFVAVLGHNGSGKSTFAKHCNAVLLPRTGTVMVDGMDTRDEDKLFEIRQCAGMVFQNPDNQIVATVVEEDVAFAPENMGVEPAEIRRRVDEALKAVGMYEYRESAPHQLSGGMCQRASLARALIGHPKALLLDEPLGALDAFTRMNMQDELLRIKAEQNMTMVMVTHDVDEAVYLSNKIVVMSPRPAKIEEILEVHLSQPRDRNNPEFIRLRSEILKVLDFAGREKDVEYTI